MAVLESGAKPAIGALARASERRGQRDPIADNEVERQTEERDWTEGGSTEDHREGVELFLKNLRSCVWTRIF